MPRQSAFVQSLSAFASLRGRLGAWLGVLALVAQLLVPVSPVQAAPWAEEGLFPPTCSVHAAADGSASLLDQNSCGQCPLCQLHAGGWLSPPLLAVSAVTYPPTAPIGLTETRPAPPGGVSAHPPLPSRGPPSAA